MRLCRLFAMILATMLAAPAWSGGDQSSYVVYDGFDGPGKGKHIVLISGDEEYRSEEALPQLGKILARHHGFKCTVLFAVDKDGTINPNVSHIPGLEALASADLAIVFLRFRNLPDEQMKHLADYIESGRPIIGLRTATHAFNIPKGKTYAKYGYNHQGGFGRQVLGETWVAHHGIHGKQSTRGILAPATASDLFGLAWAAANDPICRGIKDGDIWGPTDVYRVNLPLPGDSRPLVLGQVLEGMKPGDPPVGKQEVKKKVKDAVVVSYTTPNDPMMPIAWTRTYKGEAGKTARVFTTTMGASQDLESVGLRRLLVNAAYWAVGMEDRIAAGAPVDVVGQYRPTPFGFNTFTKGVRPADLRMK